MPDTKLLHSEKGKYFAIRRFDRSSGGGVHVHTASGLLELDHGDPQIDYEALLNLTRILTGDARYVQQMFKRMTFNVLARNRDDHTKNHAFQMSSADNWKPTPAYDLTLSGGKGGQHNLAVPGEGANPGFKEIMQVATAATIPNGEAEAIFQEVKDAVDKWPDHAKKGELSERRTAEVDYLPTAAAASRRRGSRWLLGLPVRVAKHTEVLDLPNCITISEAHLNELKSRLYQ